MPYLDGRQPIIPITNPLGTAGRGYTQGGIYQTIQTDVLYYWTEHGKWRILTSFADEQEVSKINTLLFEEYFSIPSTMDIADRALRSRWSPPSGPITRNTQVTEKNQSQSISVSPQPSLISEQEKAGLIPNVYENTNSGSKNWIVSHGKVRYPEALGYKSIINLLFDDFTFIRVTSPDAGTKPSMYSADQYGGTEVFTATYTQGGKNGAFIENLDDLTYTAKDLHKHPATDSGARGSTLKRLREIGQLQ